MSKSYPIFCTANEKQHYRLANLALDRFGNPIELLWCKKCRAEYACRAEHMLQTWRELLVGNEQAICSQIARLNKAIRDLESDLEDLQRTKENV